MKGSGMPGEISMRGLDSIRQAFVRRSSEDVHDIVMSVIAAWFRDNNHCPSVLDVEAVLAAILSRLSGVHDAVHIPSHIVHRNKLVLERMLALECLSPEYYVSAHCALYFRQLLSYDTGTENAEKFKSLNTLISLRYRAVKYNMDIRQAKALIRESRLLL
jgi:hypothetical protein